MIGDDIRSGLAELRAEAESLMDGYGVISRVVSETLDTETNALVPVLEPVYEGPMRVWHGRQGAVAEVAGQLVTANPLLCAIPHRVAGVLPGMIVELDVSDDPDLVGVRLVVKDVSRHEQAVRRVLTLADHQG